MSKAAPESLESLLADAGWLAGLARALVRGEDRAQDVVQETRLYALEHPPRHGRNLRSWVAAVARSAARQILRRERRRTRRETRAARDVALPDTSAVVERVELRRKLADMVLGLPEPSRTAVMLRYFEEMSPREIAKRLGTSSSTVRSRISRGLDELRRRLDREHDRGRRGWCLTLLPLCRPAGTAPAATFLGGLAFALSGVAVMSAKAKIAVAVVLAAGLSVAVWRGFAGPPRDAPPPRVTSRTDAVDPQGDPESAVGAPPASGPPAEPAPATALEVVAEGGRIAGRVVYDDGDPASGIYLTAYFGEHLIHVENYANVAVTDEDGAFSFPAVLGGPYRVGLLSNGLEGVLSGKKDLQKEVRGGDTDLLFALPRVGTLVLLTIDSESGDPVPAFSYHLRWTKDGKSVTGVGFPYAMLPELHQAPAPRGHDAERILLSKSRFRVLLPPLDAVDRGTKVALGVRFDAKSYEPGVLEIDRSDLGKDLGELELRAIRLPESDGGWRLAVRVLFENGEPFSGEGRLYVERADRRVQERNFEVADGSAVLRGLACGADEAVVHVAGKSARTAPCPAVEGAVRNVEITLPVEWELVVDPRFEAEPRRLRLSVKHIGSATGALLRSVTVGARSWPHTIKGGRGGPARVALSDDSGEVVSETVELTPGKKTVVKPRVPTGRR